MCAYLKSVFRRYSPRSGMGWYHFCRAAVSSGLDLDRKMSNRSVGIVVGSKNWPMLGPSKAWKRKEEHLVRKIKRKKTKEGCWR
jgi:hypothetical protein